MGKKKFLKGIDNLVANTSNTNEAFESKISKSTEKEQGKLYPPVKKNTKSRSLSGELKSPAQEQLIKLGDILTIDRAQKLKALLTDAMMKSDHLRLIAENCKAIDLSAIQLLFTIYKTAQKENKTITIDIAIGETQKNLLKNTGIYDIIFTGDETNKLLAFSKI
jgi:hypothetical protein